MLRRHPLSVLVAIAAGGALGASARYGVGLALPQGRDDLPWATLLINVTGCLAIGALLVLILEVWVAHRLLRPFLGVGVGAYTTFSTYVVEAQQLVRAGRPALALAYLVATVIAALAAVQLGITLTRASVRVAAKFETVRLAEEGARLYAALTVVANVVVSFSAAAIGYTLGLAW